MPGAHAWRDANHPARFISLVIPRSEATRNLYSSVTREIPRFAREDSSQIRDSYSTSFAGHGSRCPTTLIFDSDETGNCGSAALLLQNIRGVKRVALVRQIA